MRLAFASALLLALTHTAHAQTQTFYLHHGAAPVAVPGGTTQSFLDALAPTNPTPLVDEHVVASGNSATFPTFTAPAFAADTTLLPIASVRLQLGTNAKIRGCADISTELFRVDGGGGLTSIGTHTATDSDVLQASAGGTVGTGAHRLEFPISGNSILTGQSIAVASSLTNGCGINRRIFFAYDGATAPARVRFQCCFTTAARCAEAKLKGVGSGAACLLGVAAHRASHGDALDPEKRAKCTFKLTTIFEKADAKGGCVATGDGATHATATETFADDLTADLDPVGGESRCQSGKLKLAAKVAACLLKLQAKAAHKGEFLDPDPTAVAKCRSAIELGFPKLELKGPCDTTDDAAATLATIDAFVTDEASVLACPCS
jgi:hypothetical protein